MNGLEFTTYVGILAAIAVTCVLVATIAHTPLRRPDDRALDNDERLAVFRLRWAEHTAKRVVSRELDRQLAPMVAAAERSLWDQQTTFSLPVPNPSLAPLQRKAKARREPDSVVTRLTRASREIAPRTVRGSGKTV